VSWLDPPHFAIRSGALLVESGEHVGRALIALCALLVAAWLGRALRQQGTPLVRAVCAPVSLVAMGLLGARLVDAWATHDWTGGGYSAAGAMLAAPIGILMASRICGVGVRRLADSVSLIGLVALATTRLGCLADGCDYGRPGPASWGVRYVGDEAILHRFRLAGVIGDSATVSPLLHAFPVYESLALLALAAVLATLRVRLQRREGALAAVAAVGWGAIRIATEAYRGNVERAALPVGITIGALAVVAGMVALLWLRYGPTSTGSSGRADHAQNEPG
jgi:prolipoprotein diacylglyceryltransferase